MRLDRDLGHLTYCTNVHPGESLGDVRHQLATLVPDVKRRVAGSAWFGVGLRLSAGAAKSLAEGDELDRLRDLLDAQGLYVVTLNGFPHGSFHGERVKEQVYRPDWLESERLAYTNRLAGILARLIPPSSEATISTVPGASKDRVGAAADYASIGTAMVRHAAHLHELRKKTDRIVKLAIEPEPCCMLETTAETVAFFETHLLSRSARELFCALTGVPHERCESELRRHLTVCLDACHAAVEHEDARSAVATLRGAGISIGKVQLSSGLRVAPVDPERLRALERFADDVYLHQVVARRGESITRFSDLTDAFAASETQAFDEWRVHFHVPIFLAELGPFEGTQPFVRDLLALHVEEPITTALEVETYTWDVLPDDLREGPVTASIARELAWVKEWMARCAGTSR